MALDELSIREAIGRVVDVSDSNHLPLASVNGSHLKRAQPVAKMYEPRLQDQVTSTRCRLDVGLKNCSLVNQQNQESTAFV